MIPVPEVQRVASYTIVRDLIVAPDIHKARYIPYSNASIQYAHIICVDLPIPVALRTAYLSLCRKYSHTLPSELHEKQYIISHASILIVFPVVKELMYSC